MTEVRKLFQEGKEFVPITLAEAVVVNTNNLVGFSGFGITTLDKVLVNLVGLVGTNTANILKLLSSKQDKLTAGNGITIDENGVISTTATIGDIYKIVSVLPTASADVTNTLYLVPTTSTDTDSGMNIFVEYLCVKLNNGVYKWEKLGEVLTSTDLSGYVSSVPMTTSAGKIVYVNYEIPTNLYDNLMSNSNVTTNTTT